MLVLLLSSSQIVLCVRIRHKSSLGEYWNDRNLSRVLPTRNLLFRMKTYVCCLLILVTELVLQHDVECACPLDSGEIIGIVTLRVCAQV